MLLKVPKQIRKDQKNSERLALTANVNCSHVISQHRTNNDGSRDSANKRTSRSQKESNNKRNVDNTANNYESAADGGVGSSKTALARLYVSRV